MSKPITKEQRRVLGRMARGYELFCSGSSFYFRTSQATDWSQYAVRNSTCKVLERLGYIEEIIGVGLLFRITDAGRAVIAISEPQ
jgi:hypothetical protein